jgi:heme/copper-type cytochrome/quinol oxidase subunit 2
MKINSFRNVNNRTIAIVAIAAVAVLIVATATITTIVRLRRNTGKVRQWHKQILVETVHYH